MTAVAHDAVVTPWAVRGRVDYDALLGRFGCEAVDEALVARFERVTGRPAHRFLRRGVFFAHRDLHALLDAHEAGQPFYVYTGRGPSSEALHLGHVVPFQFAKWLQDAFGAPVVVQLTDDEKVLWRGLEVEGAERLARQNARDIIAFGFDPARTFLFTDFGYIGGLYRNVLRIQRCVPMNQVRGIFGLTPDDSIGKIAFPAVQAAPALHDSFAGILPARVRRCLVPCAVDQDPYFRMTRDVAPRLGHAKPALVECRFLPPLEGPGGKMSAGEAAVYVTDSPAAIRRKIGRFAFTGGGATVEEHRRRGADLEVDVPWAWLQFFLEDDDELRRVGEEYRAGRMLSGEVKDVLVGTLVDLTRAHRLAREAVTEDVIDEFMRARPLAS